MKTLHKLSAAVVAGITALVIGSTNAMAALSVDQQAVVDAIDLMIDDMIVVGWGLILLVMGFTLGAKIFKKFMNRST